MNRVDPGVPFKVLLLGAGQIGSRHLQGLARSRLNLSIEILDPSASACELAIRRFNEIPANKAVKTLRAIDSIDSCTFRDEVDLAIIATGAAARFGALQTLLDRVSVRYVVLEKVLFQRSSDLQDATALLSKNGSRAWVNCARRKFSYVRYLKDLFFGDVISISAQGGGWGLACNGIHLLDLLAFLSGVSIPTGWNIDLLDDELYESKRSDCTEFGGRIVFSLQDGHEIAMRDDKMSAAPLVIDIMGRRARATVFESAQLMVVSRAANNWKMDRHDIQVPFQSELTNLVVEEILLRGVCELTGFSESSRLHKVYLEAFLNHMEKVTGMRQDICPIS